MNKIIENFDSNQICEVFYNDYITFEYNKITLKEANEIYKKIKETNYNDFYFRVFNENFDYIHNYGEEIIDTEKVTGELEKYFLNDNIKNLGIKPIFGIKKENFPSFLRFVKTGGDN